MFSTSTQTVPTVSPSIQTVPTVSPSIQTVSTVSPPSTGSRLSATSIGITAASSILGTGIITIAVTCFFRRRKKRTHPRSSDGNGSSSSSGPSTIAQLSNNTRASWSPPEAPWQSPRSSEGFSRVAAHPDSSSTPPAQATTSFAGVRLFAELSAVTRSHSSPPEHPYGSLSVEPRTPRGALRAELAALREEVAWLSGDREVPPPYRPSP